MGKVNQRREAMDVAAPEARPEEALGQQGAQEGLAGARRAVEGEDQGLGGLGILHKLLQALDDQLPGQRLPHQAQG